MHLTRIALALLAALANKIARRALTVDRWIICNMLCNPAHIGLIWLATSAIAKRHRVVETDAQAR